MAGELKIRLAEIIEDKDLSNRYSDKVINDLKKHKVEIVTMIKELIEWLENLKVKKLSIIGPNTEFFNMLLRSEE
jgi:maleate cis-trans isomerase